MCSNSGFYSYFGGAIGGIISGTFTFLGVYYTISYYKESELENDRKKVLPFLLIDYNTDQGIENEPGFSLFNPHRVSGPIDYDKEVNFQLKIVNIGNGFAKTNIFFTGYSIEGNEFCKTIMQEKPYYFSLLIAKEDLIRGATFGIQFRDPMSNTYNQYYHVYINKNGRYVFDSDYPKLVKKSEEKEG